MMNKKNVTIFLFIVSLTIIIILAELVTLGIYKYNKYSYDEKNKIRVNSYNVKYTMENIIADLYLTIRELNEKEFHKSFVTNSKISMNKLKEINSVYDLEDYDYDLIIDEIYCLSEEKQIYNCKYMLNYSSNILDDGADVVNGEEKEALNYNNKIILKLIENNKYKVLYSKFDLGGGRYYEK